MGRQPPFLDGQLKENRGFAPKGLWRCDSEDSSSLC